MHVCGTLEYCHHSEYINRDIDGIEFQNMLAECEKSLDSVYGGKIRFVERQETMDPLAEHTEGYVIEDAAGYMVKIKLPFYTFWKKMRAAAGVAGA